MRSIYFAISSVLALSAYAELDIDLDIDKTVECEYSAYDGTCRNFDPLSQCIQSVAEHLCGDKSDVIFKSKCARLYTVLDDQCYNDCVDFHEQCCCPAMSNAPTADPTDAPITSNPTTRPTNTKKPSPAPTVSPNSASPTLKPSVSKMPVSTEPTYAPWVSPTRAPTNMPAVPTITPTMTCPFAFTLIGKTETCADFFDYIPAEYSCLFDSLFPKTNRCLGIAAFKCRKEVNQYAASFDDDECYQQCVSFHTLCCCGGID